MFPFILVGVLLATLAMARGLIAAPAQPALSKKQRRGRVI
jgi:hypothetical protein